MGPIALAPYFDRYSKRLKQRLMKNAIDAQMVEGIKHSMSTIEQFTGAKINYTTQVLARENDLGINTLNEELFIITTDIVGEMEGRSYLIFNKEAWDYVSGLAIKEHMKDAGRLREAFLKELDNIISATVISKISNAFSVKIHGAAPVLINEITSSSLLEYINQDRTRNPSHHVSVTEIHFENAPTIRPLFIWSVGELSKVALES